MQTILHLLAVDGTQRRIEVDIPREPGSDLLRSLVSPLLDDGELGHVSVEYAGRRADMFVDDDGHPKRLPRNELATTIYRAFSLRREPRADPEAIPWIAGPAVIFERTVWF